MESLTVNLFVNNLTETISFYQLLGFKTVMTVPEDGSDIIWAMMQCEGVTMMFQLFSSLEGVPEISRASGGSLLFYIKIKGIRDFYERIKPAVTIVKPIEKMFYGATEFLIKDNNGFVITFAEDEQ